MGVVTPCKKLSAVRGRPNFLPREIVSVFRRSKFSGRKRVCPLFWGMVRSWEAPLQFISQWQKIWCFYNLVSPADSIFSILFSTTNITSNLRLVPAQNSNGRTGVAAASLPPHVQRWIRPCCCSGIGSPHFRLAEGVMYDICRKLIEDFTDNGREETEPAPRFVVIVFHLCNIQPAIGWSNIFLDYSSAKSFENVVQGYFFGGGELGVRWGWYISWSSLSQRIVL